MADTRGSKRIAAEFGEVAIDLAKSVGRTEKDLLDATGRDRKTLDRLVRGEGSVLYALKVRTTLQEWGADVSRLPSIGGESVEPVEAWRKEWNELGAELHRLAAPEKWEYELSRIRKMVDAHRLVAEGTGEQRRRK